MIRTYNYATKRYELHTAPTLLDRIADLEAKVAKLLAVIHTH